MSDFDSSVEAVSGFSAPVREGLPSSYRMRAEGHYVDLLASRSPGPRDRILSTHELVSDSIEEPGSELVESIRRHGVLQPLLVQEQDDEHRVIAGHKRLRAARAAGLRDVPCIVYQVGDEKAAQLARACNIAGKTTTAAEPDAAATTTALHAGAALAQALATIAACAELLSAAPSDLTRGVVGTLVQAESARAAALLLATRIVRRELTVARTPVDVNAVLDKVARSFASERKVRRVTVEARGLAPAGTCVAGDETLLAGALSAAVLAMLPLVESAPEATIALGTVEEDGRVVLSVSQRQAVAVPAWSARAFDEQWLERPGGTTALVSLLAVRQVAETHAGEIAVTSDAGGTAVTLRLPASR